MDEKDERATDEYFKKKMEEIRLIQAETNRRTVALNEQINQVGKAVDDLSKTVESLRDDLPTPEDTDQTDDDDEWQRWKQVWLENELTRNPYKFLHLPRMRRLGILSVDEVYDLCDLLDDSEAEDLAMLDLVAKVLRRDTQEDIYLAVNALATVTRDGLESLLNRAKLLVKVTHCIVLPVAVVRDEPDSGSVEFARASRVAIAQEGHRTIVDERMFIRP